MTMKCVLTKELPEVHQALLESVGKKSLAGLFVNCPLFNNRQICLWCCMHIIEQAHPTKRQFATVSSPQYEALSTIIGKYWDETWPVCGQCANNTDR